MKKFFHSFTCSILLIAVVVVGLIIMKMAAHGMFQAEPKVEVLPAGGKNGTLTVVTDNNYWPYSFIDKDGKLSGREIEIAAIIANRLGMNLEIKALNWLECIEMAEQHQADMVLTCEETSGESRNLVSSLPLSSDDYVVFGKKPLHSVDELKGKRLAQLSYGHINPSLEAIGLKPYVTLYPSHREALEKVEADEADYSVIRYTPAMGLLKNLDFSDIKPQCLAGQSFLCIGIDKSKTELVRKVNEILLDLRINGEMQRLYDKWLTTYVRPKTFIETMADYPSFFVLLLVILAVHAVILFIREISQNKEMREANQRIRESLAFANYVMDQFASTYAVNLETREYKIYKRNGNHDKTYHVLADYVAAMTSHINHEVHPEDRAPLLAFIQPEHLQTLLKDKTMVMHDFRVVIDGQERNYTFRAIRGADEANVVFAISDMTEEVRKKLEEQQAAVRAKAITCMAGEDSVFIIDCTRDKRTTVYDNSCNAKCFHDSVPFSVSFSTYIDTCVTPADRDMMRTVTSLEYMLKRVQKENEYSINYGDSTLGIQHFYEMRIMRYSDTEVLQSFKCNDRGIISRLMLQKLSADFFALFSVDLDSGLLQVQKDESVQLLGCVGTVRNFSEAMQQFASHFAKGPRDIFEQLGDIEAMKRRFAQEDKATFLYKSQLLEYDGWAVVTEMVLSRHEDGTPSLFMLGFNMLDAARNEEIRLEQTLMESLAILGKEQSPSQSMEDLLALAGEFYGAERTYILELDKNKTVVETACEWCAKGISPMNDSLQGTPFKLLDGWLRELEPEDVFFMDATDGLQDMTRKTMCAYGIQWQIVASIRKDDDIIGFVGVNNPTKAKQNVKILKAMASVINSEIMKLKEEDEQHVTLNKLTESFVSVFYADVSCDYLHAWQNKAMAGKLIGISSFSQAVSDYVHYGIAERDRERCLAAVTPAAILKEFESKDRFSLEVTDVLLGTEHNYVFDFIKVSADGSRFVICCRDVTEVIKAKDEQRKALQGALEAAESAIGKNVLLNQIIKSGSWLFQVNGQDEITASVISAECREAVQNEFGDGDDWLQLIHPEDRDRVTEAFYATLKDHRCQIPYDVEYRTLSKMGDYHWIHAAGRMIRKGDGSGEYYGICSNIDTTVTKREQEQQQLKEDMYLIGGLASEYETLYQVNINDGLYKTYMICAENQAEIKPFITANKDAFEALHRYGSSDLIHPDDRHLFDDCKADFFREKLAHKKRFSLRFRRQIRGRYHWYVMEVIKYEAINEAANTIAIGFANRDAEIRQQQEMATARELANQQRHIKAFGKMVNAALWSMDIKDDNTIIGVNWSNEFRRMVGYEETVEAFPNTLEFIVELLHPEDRERVVACFRECERSLNTDDFVYDSQYRLRRKTGEYCWYHTVGRMEKTDRGDKRMYGIIMDISADKQLEEQRKQLEEALTKEIARTREEKIYQMAILNKAYSYYRINLSQNKIIPPIVEKIDGQPADYTHQFPEPLPSYEEVMALSTEMYVDKDYRESFLKYNNCQYLIHCFNQGMMMPEYVCHVQSKAKGWHYRKYITYLSRDDANGDIFGMTVAHDVTEEFEAEEKEKRHKKELEDAYAKVREVNMRNEWIHEIIHSGKWSYEISAEDEVQAVHFSDDVQNAFAGFLSEGPMNWLGQLVPEDRERVSNAFWASVKDHSCKTPYDVFFRILGADGKVIWYRSAGRMLRHHDDTGEFFGMYMDISEQMNKESEQRRQLENALDKAREEQLRNDTIHEIIHSGKWSFMVDANDDIIHSECSDMVRMVLGNELAKDSYAWMTVIHPDDHDATLKAFKATVADHSCRTPYDVTYRMKHAEGDYRWYHTAGRIIRKADGTGEFFGIHIDITDQIEQQLKQQQQLEEALSMAQAASRAKTTFLNSMSHDIRTPMNAIIGFTGLAASHIGNTEQVKAYLTKIGQSSSHLLSLINDVLDMSRIESGKMNLHEKAEKLPEIIHTLHDIVQADVRKKQHDFFIDTLNVYDEAIICDKLRLNQVLLNILSNAIKYTEQGGVISMRITEKAVKQSGYATYEFCIKDNGMGMDQEYIKIIFEPFTRYRTSTMSGIQGTGLGMAITKNIIDMMGGRIDIQSELDKGTQITVTFDFKLQETHKESAVIAELNGLRALVVDNDANTCVSVDAMLKDIGMRTEWCTSGQEAVFRAETACKRGDYFKVYIIDWLMTEMNGIETTRCIRKIVGEEIPIILLSAYDYSDIEEKARAAGVTNFITKPLFPSDLQRVLNSCLGKAEIIESTPKDDYDFTGKKVLLVEDNELNREIACELLQEFGFAVDVAEDGTYAVEKMTAAKEGDYDVILMDIQMPLMNGYEATRAIRALGTPIAKIPILAMTANAFEEDRKLALEAGMNDHIIKPIHVDRLKEALAKFLA